MGRCKLQRILARTVRRACLVNLHSHDARVHDRVIASTRERRAWLWSLKFHRRLRLSDRPARAALEVARACFGNKNAGSVAAALDDSSRVTIVRSGVSRAFGLGSLRLDVVAQRSIAGRDCPIEMCTSEAENAAQIRRNQKLFPARSRGLAM